VPKGDEAPSFIKEALSDSVAMAAEAETLTAAKKEELEVAKKVRATEEAERAKRKAADKKARIKAEKEKKVADEREAARKLEEAKSKAAESGEVFLDSEPQAESTTSTPQEIYNAKVRMLAGSMKRYTTDRVNAFAKAEMDGLKDPKLREQYAAPLAIFLPGRVVDDWGDEEGSGVAIHSAYDSPDTHSQVVAYMRSHAVETEAHAIILMVRKSLMAYPRVWAGKAGWDFGDKDGYFVQLETCCKADCRMWFMEVGIGGNLTQHAIDYETYRVCQTLLRDVSELPQPSSLA